MDKQNNEGFMFPYKNGRLGRSVLLFEDTIRRLNNDFHNDDNLFIFCIQCNQYMDFLKGKKNALDGKWVCRGCGRSVRETTPYHRLDSENRAYLSKINISDDYDPDDAYWDPF